MDEIKRGNAISRFFRWLGGDLKEIGATFVHGDWKTKLSFLIMGFGQLCRGQIVRGVSMLALEFGLLYFTFDFGWPYLTKLLTLGTVETHKEGRVTVYGDNSFFILLYGILAVVAVIALIYLWRVNLKQNREAEGLLAQGKRLPTNKADLASLLDKNFDKTLLALPVLGIFVFTVVPIIFMICIAFTNYDATHQPPAKLFSWVGLENFKALFGIGGEGFGGTFFYVLGWTLVWAFFATFLTYFLGMAVAILINKKGIRFKKLWRTILVMTIAVPQFVSLLYVGKMFAADGLVNAYLLKWGWIKQTIPFWTNATYARILIIVINLWIGIPYTMLIVTGLLMVRERAHRRRECFPDLPQDHAALYALRHGPLPADPVHRQPEQFQRDLPLKPGQTTVDESDEQRRRDRPARHLAVQDDDQRFKLQDRRRHRHHGLPGHSDHFAHRLQRPAVRQR